MKKTTFAFLIVTVLVLFAGCHEHVWKEATCELPQQCEGCGETQGEALGHDWSEATCFEPQVCKRCGVAGGGALGHDWKEATCTDPITCSRCKATEGEALGHYMQEATCEMPSICSRCGLTVGKALGHVYGDISCTEDSVCSRCGNTLLAKGHDWKNGACTKCGIYALDIKDYYYDNRWASYCYVVVKNNTDIAMEVSGNALAKNSDGSIVGAANYSGIDVLGPNETSIGYFFFMDVNDIGNVEYSITPSECRYWRPVVGNLSVETVIAGNNIVVTVTNNGDYAAEFVRVHALFLDENGNVVDTADTYAVDNESEIKPNASIYCQLHSYESFDTVEVYLTGRADK